MKFVYLENTLTPLTPKQLAAFANEASPFKPYSEADFMGPDDRVQRLRCQCNSGAEYDILPMLPNKYRRHVKCRFCEEVIPL